jgi:hypothetical protein
MHWGQIAVCAFTLVDTRKSNLPRLAGDNKTPEATTTLHCEIVLTILTSQLTTYLLLPSEAGPIITSLTMLSRRKEH